MDQTIHDRYATSLMDNARWVEVWKLICRLGLRISFAYADSIEWNGFNSQKVWGPFPLDYIQDRGIRDPGIGGPFLYKQTLWLRIPKVLPNNAEAFRNELERLDNIHFSENDQYIEILGYR